MLWLSRLALVWTLTLRRQVHWKVILAKTPPCPHMFSMFMISCFRISALTIHLFRYFAINDRTWLNAYFKIKQAVQSVTFSVILRLTRQLKRATKIRIFALKTNTCICGILSVPQYIKIPICLIDVSLFVGYGTWQLWRCRCLRLFIKFSDLSQFLEMTLLSKRFLLLLGN